MHPLSVVSMEINNLTTVLTQMSSSLTVSVPEISLEFFSCVNKIALYYYCSLHLNDTNFAYLFVFGSDKFNVVPVRLKFPVTGF
jgi:hypothetical protein